ncbi:uncharacterized protein LOC118190490 [Stegodyphus dumicola]|uniref:uncharacterized protein LOC118190490 n=1 Tax=Stegodyphus dumicola TaxID=202533 RepID=UPI0015AA6A2D|nr:uncharacterized protein LOC118190490 [Stegodyphus dumicola]
MQQEVKGEEMVMLARTGFGSNHISKKKDTLNKNLDSATTAALVSTSNSESLDVNGIIRVKTRITERIDKPFFISPILLPDKCIFTQRLIEYFHRENCHAGTQILLSILREKYWITRGRRAIRSVLKDCIKCRRYKTKSLITEPFSLPADIVENAAAFEVVGIDLAGPLFVKRGNKVWMVFYTCVLYRAIHLELITSLSTDAFLLSFRRFVARRGRPRVVYTDNGTNFRGSL